MKTLNQTIALTLIMTMFAGQVNLASANTIEQIDAPAILTSEEADVALEQINQIDPENTVKEAIGGSIVNKSNGDRITLECIQQNTQRDCEVVQYYQTIGLLSSPIGKPIKTQDFVTALKSFKEKAADAVTAAYKIQSDALEKEADVKMPVTKAVTQSYDGSRSEVYAVLYTIGSIAAIATWIALSAGPGAIITLSVALECAAFPAHPYLIDIIQIPIRAIGFMFKRIKLNKKLRQDLKSIKKLEDTLRVTMTEGKNDLKLSDDDFQDILKLIAGMQPVDAATPILK